MMNAVDKYSTDNIADNEMIIAVDDVVKKDYDSAVVRIKKALARLKSTGHVENMLSISISWDWYMSLRTMNQKPLNVIWRALPRQKLSAREILRLWFTAILVQAIARWEEIRKRRDISTMPETNMTVPQKNLKNVIKAGSCLTI